MTCKVDLLTNDIFAVKPMHIQTAKNLLMGCKLDWVYLIFYVNWFFPLFQCSDFMMFCYLRMQRPHIFDQGSDTKMTQMSDPYPYLALKIAQKGGGAQLFLFFHHLSITQRGFKCSSEICFQRAKVNVKKLIFSTTLVFI